MRNVLSALLRTPGFSIQACYPCLFEGAQSDFLLVPPLQIELQGYQPSSPHPPCFLFLGCFLWALLGTDPKCLLHAPSLGTPHSSTWASVPAPRDLLTCGVGLGLAGFYGLPQLRTWSCTKYGGALCPPSHMPNVDLAAMECCGLSWEGL